MRLIVTSATMDAEKLRDFFNINSKDKEKSKNSAVIMSVEGRLHPVTIYYVKGKNDNIKTYLQ